jgi:hypothetical protein
MTDHDRPIVNPRPSLGRRWHFDFALGRQKNESRRPGN